MRSRRETHNHGSVKFDVFVSVLRPVAKSRNRFDLFSIRIASNRIFFAARIFISIDMLWRFRKRLPAVKPLLVLGAQWQDVPEHVSLLVA